ncbi:MAG TPA: polymer-forming cytoskeletal protein [Verrucomicrobiae bacterium]|nr:polymer-forming cytoskeletal protein [Verrucomicrobiae bacterium]
MWRKSEEANPSSKPIIKAESAAADPSPAAASLATMPANPAVPEPPSAPPASIAAPEVVSVVTDASPSQISAGLKIRGEITGTSDLWIDGDIQGKIQLTGCKLTVGPSGRIKSDIEAREINVLGTVSGNLKAAETVTLGNTGRVEGSVVTRRIAIEDGARLRGKVEMVRVEAAPAAKAAAASARSGAASAAPAEKEKS